MQRSGHARPDRDLVAAIRAELAAVEPARACDRRAEALGLGRLPAARRIALARLAHRLGRDAERGRTGEGADAPATLSDGFDWSIAREHCRLAWLRGRFLARGSLSLAGGRTHLEFVVPMDEAALLANRLADIGLPANWRARRGSGVVTWKSGEGIVTFLRRIGAGASLLELEARSVSRALRGDLNRVVNAESANLQRAVLAAGRQLAAIDALEADGRLAEQPYVVRVVAVARREVPEATFTELAERCGLHRSAVQRALERLERLALHPDAPSRGPRAARPAASGRTAATESGGALA